MNNRIQTLQVLLAPLMKQFFLFVCRFFFQDKSRESSDVFSVARSRRKLSTSQSIRIPCTVSTTWKSTVVTDDFGHDNTTTKYGVTFGIVTNSTSTITTKRRHLVVRNIRDSFYRNVLNLFSYSKERLFLPNTGASIFQWTHSEKRQIFQYKSKTYFSLRIVVVRDRNRCCSFNQKFMSI